MKLLKRGGSWPALAAGVWAAGLSAHALEPSDVLAFSVGPLLLRPQLAVNETYDSNVFYDKSNEVGDAITHVVPGVNLFLGKRELNFVSLSYTFDQAFYAQRRDLDNENHILTLSGQWKGT